MYELNLDLPDSKRWSQIIEINREKINSSLPDIKKILSQFDPIIGRAKLAIKAASLIGKVKNAKEMKCLSKAFGLSLGEMMLLQLCFEFYGGCTVSASRVGSDPILFHSFDWPLSFLKDLFIEISFTRNSLEVARGFTFIGYVGIITGCRNGDYSIAINYRKNNFDNLIEFLDNNKLSLVSKITASFAVRDSLENNSFQEAVKSLEKVNLIFDCYISILSSSGHLTVIKRKNDFVSTSVHSIPFVVVNNDEGEENDPLYSHERRRVLNQLLKEKSEFSSITEAEEALTSFPVVNEQTIYISITSPTNRALNTSTC